MIDGKLQRAVRRQESNLGNLITDGMAAAMKEKITALLPESELSSIKGYVALQNGGGIREMIPAGDITLGQVRTVLPFDNSLVALKVTGEELILALENGVSGAPAENGAFAHVSGMKYYFDSTKAKQTIDQDSGTITFNGERIVQVQVQNSNGQFKAIDPNAFYILATNSFKANGGDFYYALKQAKDDGRTYELFLLDYEVLLEYISKFDSLESEVEGRIIDLQGKPLPSNGGVGSGGSSGGSGGSGNGTDNGTGDGSESGPGRDAGEETDASGDYEEAVQVVIEHDDIEQSTNAQGNKVTAIVVKQEALMRALIQAQQQQHLCSCCSQQNILRYKQSLGEIRY